MSLGGDAFDLDLATAALGADGSDLQIMLNQLTEKLAALKDSFSVQRSGGMFRKNGPIRRLEVKIGATEFVASLDGTSPDFRIGRVSGGIRIRSEATDAPGWTRALIEALQTEAAHSTAAREALEAIVIGGP